MILFSKSQINYFPLNVVLILRRKRHPGQRRSPQRQTRKTFYWSVWEQLPVVDVWELLVHRSCVHSGGHCGNAGDGCRLRCGGAPAGPQGSDPSPPPPPSLDLPTAGLHPHCGGADFHPIVPRRLRVFVPWRPSLSICGFSLASGVVVLVSLRSR